VTGDDRRDDEPGAGGSSPFDSIVGREEARLARGLPRGAIESPPPDPPLAPGSGRIYAAGAALGVAVLAAVVNAWITHTCAALAIFLPPTGSHAELVSSPGWRWGSLAGGVALCAGAAVLARRGRYWPSYVAAAAGVAILVMSLAGLHDRIGLPADTGWTFYTPDSLRE
jgi:hypothetical protein